MASTFDGTLAVAEGEFDPLKVGPPISWMVDRLRNVLWHGYDVRIFTARAVMGPEAIQAVKDWLIEQGLPDLPVTATKDPDMRYFYDDRAVQVEHNTGRLVEEIAYQRGRKDERH